MSKATHTAIILAGGKSSRMGTDKGLLNWNGKCLIEHVMEAAEPLNDHLMIITANTVYEKWGYPVYPDLVVDKGPLGGIVTGLSHSVTEYNVVLSCDTPNVTPSLLAELLKRLPGYDVVIPVHNGKKHPLIAAYAKTALIPLKEALALNQLKLLDALKKLKICFWNADEFDAELFVNLNTPDDL